MADLTEGDGRGQIILIAAFALAVTFVALALIVNSAIFTENLASRGETAGGDGALAARAMVEDSVGTSVRSANRYNTTTGDRRDAIERSTGRLSRQIERQQVTTGGLLNVSTPHNYHTGSRVAMNDSGGGYFTADGLSSGTADWQLVSRVEENSQPHATRAFELDVRKGGGILSSTDGLAFSNRFAVVLNNTGSPSRTWRVALWRDATDAEEIHVRTELPGGTTKECVKTVPAEEFTVSLTDGTVASQPCTALGYDQSSETYYGYGAGISTPYNVSFENGDTVRGNYSFVVANSPDTATLAASPGPGPTPYMTDAVYAADVEFTYVNANINYTADVRVAPGEPDA